MNIIKAVKTANKIQKVKVKAKKTLATAGKFAIGAAVLGLGAYAIHKNNEKKRTSKIEKELEKAGAKDNQAKKIGYKKKKRAARLENKKSEHHGAHPQNAIHAESVDI